MERNYFGKFREILQLGHRYHRKYTKDFECSYGDLSMIQQHVINYILKHDKEDVYQKDIERVFLISRSTASTMLKSLEKKGIISRVPTENDARLKKLIIAEPFKKQFQPIYQELKKLMNDMNKQMCQGISKQDLAVFNRVLEQMKNNLQQGE